MRTMVPVLLAAALLAGCASAIVDGEHARTGMVLAPLPTGATVDLYMDGKMPNESYTEVGVVNSRAWVLEKALDELRRQARALGANGVIGVIYERRFSADYLQDLYFVRGTAVAIQ